MTRTFSYLAPELGDGELLPLEQESQVAADRVGDATSESRICGGKFSPESLP
jgi:hypothetical protein